MTKSPGLQRPESNLGSKTAENTALATGMCGAELFPAGQGEDENPRGRAGRR